MGAILDQWRWHLVAAAAPLALLVFYRLRLAMVTSQLPERIAVHFNAAHEADGWMSLGSWATVSSSMQAVVVLVSLLLGPGLYPMPMVAYWLVAGLLWGSFLEVLRIARGGGRFQPALAGLWALVAVAAAVGLAEAMRGWWHIGP